MRQPFWIAALDQSEKIPDVVFDSPWNKVGGPFGDMALIGSVGHQTTHKPFKFTKIAEFSSPPDTIRVATERNGDLNLLAGNLRNIGSDLLGEPKCINIFPLATQARR